MFEVVKKSILAGIGVMAVTEEKVQEVLDEFVEKGKLTQKEGESLFDEVQKIVQENKEKVSAMIDERVKFILDELHLLTKEDLTEMETRLKDDLTKIDKRLAKIEQLVKSD